MKCKVYGLCFLPVATSGICCVLLQMFWSKSHWRLLTTFNKIRESQIGYALKIVDGHATSCKILLFILPTFTEFRPWFPKLFESWNT